MPDPARFLSKWLIVPRLKDKTYQKFGFDFVLPSTLEFSGISAPFQETLAGVEKSEVL